MPHLAEGKGRVGLIPLLVGVILLALAALDPRPQAFPAGRPPVVAAALVFVFAGTAMLINSLVTPYRDALLRINSALLLGSFAGVPLGIAWSTGAEWPLVLAGLLCLGLATLAVGWGIADAWRIMRERKGRPTTG